jgi:hypothetical protein
MDGMEEGKFKRTENVSVVIGPSAPYERTNPNHYSNDKNIQPIEVIEDWDLGHHLACVVKYISRYKLKGTDSDAEHDLEKALWYLERKIKINSVL